MLNEDLFEIVCMTIIAGRKQKDSLLVALSKAGGRLVNILYGRGSAKPHYIRDMFGLVPEENKVVIICLMRKDKSDAMLNILVNEFHFDEPNTGIAFTLSVEGLAF